MPGWPGGYDCPYCDSHFSAFASFNYHRARCPQRPDAPEPEPEPTTFECPNCGDERANPNALRLHIDAQHYAPGIYVNPSEVWAGIERLEQELAFALWCYLNGRVYEA